MERQDVRAGVESWLWYRRRDLAKGTPEYKLLSELLEELTAGGQVLPWEGKKSDPEPEFVIKAKDQLAVTTIRAYKDLCIANGLTDQAYEVELAKEEMVAWRQRNADRVKMPDHKHRPVHHGG